MFCKVLIISTAFATAPLNPCEIERMEVNSLWDRPMCDVYLRKDGKQELVKDTIDESCDRIIKQIKEKL